MPVILNALEKNEKRKEKHAIHDESEMRKQIESTTIQELFED